MVAFDLAGRDHHQLGMQGTAFTYLDLHQRRHLIERWHTVQRVPLVPGRRIW